ncbi:MAG: acyl-CoA thioesterase [Thermoguttaceae bacterium]|nr:acyl-CoA thioesterase [Thermoguttaceae bacterium]
MNETNDSNSQSAPSSVGRENVIQFRVRYQETDQMGVVYHGNYFTYFEMGRTELLREATGVSYREVEEDQTMMVVVKAECSYLKPALYDDVLTLKTRVARITKASLEHEHELYRGDELLATGRIRLATVNKQGKIVPVPAWIRDLDANAQLNRSADKATR